MKLSLILSAELLLDAAFASAQPTLTAAAHMPAIGLRSEVYRSSHFIPGAAGANETWDVSKLPFNAPIFGTFESCNVFNGCTAFPGATTAYNYAGTFVYYQTTANSLSVQGFSNGSSRTFYSNPEDCLRFPFAYGESFVDEFASSYDVPGGTYFRTGVDSISADAWGTLITPAGTFPNTLRVKMISTFVDSGKVGVTQDFVDYKSYTYYWYDAAHRDYLFTTVNINISPRTRPSQMISYSRYTNRQSLAVEPSMRAGLQCLVVPNPARGKVQIAITLDAAQQTAISLTDITGRTVLSLPVTNLKAGETRLSLPAEGLPGGVYMLRIIAGDEVVATKVVIE